MGTLRIVVISEVEIYSFMRGESKSYIDITLATEGIARMIKGWKELLEKLMSRHSHIFFDIADDGAVEAHKIQMKGKRIFDKQNKTLLEGLREMQDINVISATNTLTRAQRKSSMAREITRKDQQC